MIFDLAYESINKKASSYIPAVIGAGLGAGGGAFLAVDNDHPWYYGAGIGALGGAGAGIAGMLSWNKWHDQITAHPFHSSAAIGGLIGAGIGAGVGSNYYDDALSGTAAGLGLGLASGVGLYKAW